MTAHPPLDQTESTQTESTQIEPTLDIQTDTLLRFIFDGVPVRGAWVQLTQSWQDVRKRHDYPSALSAVLGEMLAAAPLLTAGLKLEGALILQMQGAGPLQLAVAECTDDLIVRATATVAPDTTDFPPFPSMLGDGGHFAVTLDIRGAKEPYQGIVPLEGERIGEMLENYMWRSEQLETRLFLASDAHHAAGLLLQRLPAGHGDAAVWPTIEALAETLKDDELLNLPAETVLYRLFHDYTVRMLDARPVQFGCRCSREKVENMLRLVGKEEAESVVAEQGSIEVDCEFCRSRYVFEQEDLNVLYQPTPSGMGTTH